jgi:hypothetical protein
MGTTMSYPAAIAALAAAILVFGTIYGAGATTITSPATTIFSSVVIYSGADGHLIQNLETGGAGTFSELDDTTFTGLSAGHLVTFDGENWTNIATSSLALSLEHTTGTLGPTRGGTGLTEFSLGDLLFASAANTLSALGIGTAGDVLIVSGDGTPTWVATSTLGISGASTFLALSDTPGSFTASAIPFVDDGALVFNEAFTFDGTTLTTPSLTLSDGILTALSGLDLLAGSGDMRFEADSTSDFIFRTGASGSVSVDNTSTHATESALTTHTYSHTVSGSDRLLIVQNAVFTFAEAPVSVTYNGEPLTKLTDLVGGDENIRNEVWYLVAPDTGTHDVVVTYTEASELLSGAISFTGVHQSVPLGTHATTSGESTSVSNTVTSAEGELVFDAVTGYNFEDPFTATPGGEQTHRWDLDIYGSLTRAFASTKPGDTSVSMTLTLSESSFWTSIAVPIRPAEPAVERMRLTSTGLGIGTTTPTSALSVVGSGLFTGSLTIQGTATSTFAGGINILTEDGCFAVNGTCIGAGGNGASTFLELTDTPGSFTASAIPFVDGGALAFNENFVFDGLRLGIGTSSPSRRLSVAHEVAEPQMALAYDASRFAEFRVDAAGNLHFSTTSGNIEMNDANLFVCQGGACPTTTATSSAGNLFVENAVTIGDGFSIRQISESELGLYDTSGQVMVIFDDGI